MVRFALTWLISFAAIASSSFCQDAVNPKCVEKKLSRVDWASVRTGLNSSAVIDMAVEQSWIEESIQPAPRCDDATFARRIYLDLVGRVPTRSEQELFLASANSDKRERLVDHLLDSEEHAIHFAEVLDALLIGRTNLEQLKRRAEAGWIEYLKVVVRTNRAWNEVAREILLARNSDAKNQGANWYLYARNNKAQDIAEAVSRDFFGVRIDCAQCHDHPLASEIEQRHYWGLVAFFNRSKNVEAPKSPRVSESAIGGFSEFANVEGQSKPNELVYLGGRHVPEMRPAKDAKEDDKDELYAHRDEKYSIPKFSRREQFVDNVLKDHPLLAQSTVNRLWGWMLGRGIVHPVDALDSYHPASHPDLLDWLARDFAASGYNVRRLIRSIALSRTYQLESKQSSMIDPKWFSYSLAKPLTAEMLHRSMVTVLKPKDVSSWNSIEHRQAFATLFPDVLAEETLANVAQGLMLTNSSLINKMATAEQSQVLSSVIESDPSDKDAIYFLFQGILGRSPDQEELIQSQSFVAARESKRTLAIEGLAWALLTSAEFRFNH